MTKEKIYKVFISSPYKDLVEERSYVIQAILECNCFPEGMEFFQASNKSSWDVIKKKISECDYFILILAGKYGTVPAGDNISYTEREYFYANSINIPIIPFFYKNIDSLPSGRTEKQQIRRKKLEKFKEAVVTSRQPSFWENSYSLASAIKTALPATIKEYPSVGYTKTTLENIDNLETWSINRIFASRAEKNQESDPKLEKNDIKILDGIAFGLTSFRSKRKTDLFNCLNNGLNVRFLVMDPHGVFIKSREKEEKVLEGSISKSIEELVLWAKDLNKKSKGGRISIKAYNSMTLDFYWRIDDTIYTGPYLYNIASQQTLTYKFTKGGEGFKFYTKYFEELWSNKELCYLLV